MKEKFNLIHNKQMEKSNKLNKIYLAIILIYFLFDIYNIGLHKFLFYNSFKFLTMWVVNNLFLYVIIRMFYKKINRFLDIYFNILFTCSIFVSTFYWKFVFPTLDLKWNWKFILKQIYEDLNLHIFPLIFVMLEYYFNKEIIFKYKYFGFTCIIFIFYLGNNAYFVLVLLDIPYKILNFKDINTFYICLLAFIFGLIIHFLFTFIRKNILKIKIKTN